MPEISVIVPVYKVEKFIHRCVDSVLGQSYRDFELILVDDGSPDSCGAICDAYALQDSRVRVIHQKNGGLSAARNTGIDYVMANSASHWLVFVDSDDWVHPEYLQTLYSAAEQTLCKISACGFFRTEGEDFPQEQELKEKLERLATLDALLNMDKKGNEGVVMGEPDEAELPLRKRQRDEMER